MLELKELVPERFDKVLIATLSKSDKLAEDIKMCQVAPEPLVYFFDLDGISSGGNS